MKVFQMNDCEWWAAETLEEAKSSYFQITGLTEADRPFDDPHELSAKEMDRLQFIRDDGSVRSFRDQLDWMVSNGKSFPCFFGSTEE